MMELLRFVPKSYLSFIMGWLSGIRLPQPFRTKLIEWFASKYQINLSEAAKPLEDYQSIRDFFTRDLKPGVRPIQGEIVYPVDGTLRNTGIVTEGSLEQIKGRTYSITELLGDSIEAKRFEGGKYFNLYLSPQDYHHVHSPVSGEIRKIIHIPGKLWPVNDWSINAIPNLFAVNERIAIFITTPGGEVVVVMVGATNVGRISLTFDSLMTNTAPWVQSSPLKREYKKAVPIRVGERLGTFHLGSSVVMVCDATLIANVHDRVQSPCKVTYGTKIS